MPDVGFPELAIVALIFALMVIVPIVVIVKLLGNRTERRDPTLDALRTRFAAGEIDEAEYERLRSVLRRF